MKIITKTSPLMRGEDIKLLQTAMNALGYDCGNADGVAGEKTIKAVRQFADKHTTRKIPEILTVTVKGIDEAYTRTIKKAKAKA